MDRFRVEWVSFGQKGAENVLPATTPADTDSTAMTARLLANVVSMFSQFPPGLNNNLYSVENSEESNQLGKRGLEAAGEVSPQELVIFHVPSYKIVAGRPLNPTTKQDSAGIGGRKPAVTLQQPFFTAEKRLPSLLLKSHFSPRFPALNGKMPLVWHCNALQPSTRLKNRAVNGKVLFWACRFL